MLIKIIDASGGFHIHDNIESVVVHTGRYFLDNPFKNVPKTNTMLMDAYYDTYLPTGWGPECVNASLGSGPSNFWLDPRAFNNYDCRTFGVIDAKLKGLDCVVRYLVNDLAYVTNDDGKTLHKVEVTYSAEPVAPPPLKG